MNCQLSFYMFKLSRQKYKKKYLSKVHLEPGICFSTELGWSKLTPTHPRVNKDVFLDVSSTSSKSSLEKEEKKKCAKPCG